MRSERRAPPAANSAARASERTPAPAKWNKAAYVALFIFLALTAAQCARLGAAGLLVQTAQIELDRSTAISRTLGTPAVAVRTPSLLAIRNATQYFTNSLAYTAYNPWALEGLGALDLARMRTSRIPREALASTRDARERFRQALRQRPTSPFLWANLALTKLYLDEIDAELLTALRQADALGPWEPGVQQTLLFVGLATWQELDPGLRTIIARTLERGALRNRQKMFEIVKSYRRFDLVCAIADYAQIAGPDCGKAGAAGSSGVLMKQGQRQ
jgi:hypothetical protein